MFKKIIKELQKVPRTYILYAACVLAIIAFGSLIPKTSVTREVDVAREVVAPHVVPYRIGKIDNRRFATGFHLQFLGKTYIVTNRHVCDLNKEQVDAELIKFGSDAEQVIAVDTEHDLCLVTSRRKTGLKLSPVPVQLMEKVILVGHPRGIGLTIREGRAIEEIEMFAPWLLPNPLVIALRVSTLAYGGNSGSPVTNEKGEVIGVLFAGNDKYPNEPMVVPHQALVNFLMRTILKAPAGFNLKMHSSN